MMGLPSLARGERARARFDREGAATELERAQLRHTPAPQLQRNEARECPAETGHSTDRYRQRSAGAS